MRATDRLCVAVALAMLLGTVSLAPLTTDRLYLALGAVMIALIEAASLLLRRANRPSVVVHAVQLLVLVVFGGLVGWFSTSGGHSPSQLVAMFRESVIQVRTQQAPMTATPGVRWLTVLLIGLVTLIADLLVLTLLSPAWILAPLLSLYLIPALALRTSVPWLVFGALGMAYLLVLAIDGINSEAAWTRNLATDSAERTHSSQAALRLAAIMGIPALALSLALGLLFPSQGTLDIQTSRPRGQGPLQMADPTIDLSKNLNSPADRVVLTYKADEPLYLRTASLTVVDSQGWHLAPVQLADGNLPTPPGLDLPGKTVGVDVQVGDLSGEYLPAPYAPQSYDAKGEWRYDPQTLMLVSTKDADRTQAIRDLSYHVSATLNDPVAQNFTLAQPGTPSDASVTASVPKGIPDAILKTTSRVTASANTPVLKAAAIQAWLSDPRNFTYSTTAPPGDGFDVLANFLTRDKAGYCIHFASAMALMSRIEGIPSRVSIGFLPGEKVGDHYEVKASNMHAWPELYFSGYGWVRFEPTSRIASQPQWSLVNKDVKPLPSASASGGARSTAPKATPSASRKPSATPSATATPKPKHVPHGIDWSLWLTRVGGVLGTLLLVCAPALLRLLTRRRRLAIAGRTHAGVAGAWAEVRDTWRDVGQEWPTGTPREISQHLVGSLQTAGATALGTIAMAVERSRYARDLGEAAPLTDEVNAVRGELLGQATRGQRILAWVLPRSLWFRLSDVLAGRRDEEAAATRRQHKLERSGSADEPVYGEARIESDRAARAAERQARALEDQPDIED